MGIERKNVDIAADIVRNALSLKTPISVSDLKHVISEQLPGRCVPDSQLSVDAEIRTIEAGKKFEVRYQEEKPDTRMLFSIAHELGHLFLHLLNQNGTLKETGALQRSMAWNEEELEANEFAAAFLMPEDEFVESCRRHVQGNRINITKVAEDFNVSVQAATVRGNVLGLWQ